MKLPCLLDALDGLRCAHATPEPAGPPLLPPRHAPQAIALLDTLDKDVNTFVMRVREWYSWHFPELVKICNDNYQYAQVRAAPGRARYGCRAVRSAPGAGRGCGRQLPVRAGACCAC